MYLYLKIKDVINQSDDLIRRIKTDQKDRGKLEEPLCLNVYNTSDNLDQSTTDLNGSFIHNLLLIDVLVRMSCNENDKQKLIEFCKEEYAETNSTPSVITEFEHDYKPEKAVWWYTRNTFVYPMLNKALRTQNIERLLLFHFVIRDLYQQLKENQCRDRITVYRYQYMSKDELKYLKRSINQFISTNSFFSTTANRDIAINFANRLSEMSSDLLIVLFIIEANPDVAKSKPFADIRSLSFFPHECEVLFMIGCIFRLLSIQRNETEKIWEIRMELAGDDDIALKNLFYHFKRDYGGGEEEVGLESFGTVLHHMGKIDEAEKIYDGLRQRYSGDDNSYVHFCFSLGILYKDREDYNRSLKWFETALERKHRTEPNDLIYLAGLHCSIGNIYVEKQSYDKAMKHYNKAKDYYERAHDVDHCDVASLFHGFARVYFARKQYSNAIHYYEKSLKIQRATLPTNHPDMAFNYCAIGDILFAVREYHRAMESYKQALEIRKKALNRQHRDLALINKKIGCLYETLKQLKDALDHYKRAFKIYRHSYSDSHSILVELSIDIQRVTSKLK